jgi:hypothetical protein
LFFLALNDKGRGKEGSWEDRKLGRWEKEEDLEAGKIVNGINMVDLKMGR